MVAFYRGSAYGSVMALPAVLALPLLGYVFFTGRRRSQTRRRSRRPSPQDKSGTDRRKTAHREQPAISRVNFRDRIYLSPDGSFGSVGTNWWEAHGKRIFAKAQKVQCDDVVLETVEQAVPNFKWDQDPLPSGAQKLYDNVATRIKSEDGVEVPEHREVAPRVAPGGHVAPAPQVAKTRRANRTKTPEQKAAAKVKREAKRAAAAKDVVATKDVVAAEKVTTDADTQPIAAPQEAPHGGDDSSNASVEG